MCTHPGSTSDTEHHDAFVFSCRRPELLEASFKSYKKKQSRYIKPHFPFFFFKILYLFVALVSSFSLYDATIPKVNKEAKNFQLAMARIKKGVNHVLLKILCTKRTIPTEAEDQMHDTSVKENVSGHTLSELSDSQTFLRYREKSSGTEKTPATESESQSLIASPTVSETVPIASGESDIENLDNKETQSKSGIGDSKEVSSLLYS